MPSGRATKRPPIALEQRSLTESDIDQAIRDIQLSLLEADVRPRSSRASSPR